MERSIVYFTSDISPASLSMAYDAFGVARKGKAAVKLSAGEPGGGPCHTA